MTEPSPVSDTVTSGSTADAAEDERTQRRRLVGVWLAAGSAVAAMVGVSWYMVVAGNGGQAPGGDMTGHAAAAEWLRTLPWWDWRGWSDWFYGGQAIGVNYPPLGHALMRFTHPVHGQMAAVALGLLVLLPWGALRLAQAVGYAPRAQRAAVAAVLVLAAASGQMHWVLSGFHQQTTFFGSWPAMLATVIGLFAAAWAACCRRPVASGVVVGVAVLFNATVVPGVAVVCAALLATSGASFRQAVRWAATAGAAALAVCAWWLVPFVAGWTRLVRWEVPLSTAWSSGGTWQAAMLAMLATAAAWAARSGAAPARRLAIATAAGLLATVLSDLFGYLRSERWLEMPILVAALAAAALVADRGLARGSLRRVRPAWVVLSVAFLIVLTVITLRLELLPLAAWLMLRRPRRTWAWSGALAWAAVLLLVPVWSQIRSPGPLEGMPVTSVESAAGQGGPDAEGLVYTDTFYEAASGDREACSRGHDWRTTVATDGRIRPLNGLYQETSASAEFLLSEPFLRFGLFRESGGWRPHWFDAWDAAGSPSLDSPAAAEALGARWYAVCDADGNVSVTELPAVLAEGVTVMPYPDEEAWHQAATEWWVSTVSGSTANARSGPAVVPILAPNIGEPDSRLAGQAASGVSLQAEQDRLTVRAEGAGWAWLRVPWDPDWRAVTRTSLHKGGPGHLVVWVEEGTTELRWSVPGTVDAAAAATAVAAALAAAALAMVNRHRGFQTDPDRPQPAAYALDVFADTVDAWVHATARVVRRVVARCRRRE